MIKETCWCIISVKCLEKIKPLKCCWKVAQNYTTADISMCILYNFFFVFLIYSGFLIKQTPVHLPIHAIIQIAICVRITTHNIMWIEVKCRAAQINDH